METEIMVKELTDELKGKYPFGIKAYGEWNLFTTKTAYKRYLADWIAGTDGAEQSRAVNAQVALASGRNYYDSDAE